LKESINDRFKNTEEEDEDEDDSDESELPQKINKIVPIFKDKGPVYVPNRLNQNEIVKKFCCKIIKKDEANNYFVGVALLESGGIDFYYNFRRVYSHEFDPFK
jgi:hypothetical protein